MWIGEFDTQAGLPYVGTGIPESLPYRAIGENMLIDRLPHRSLRILDLACGDGRQLAVVLEARPGSTGVGLESSPALLGAARIRFEQAQVDLVEHDLNQPLPDLGSFDAVIVSFAIHRLPHPRKRELYEEVFASLDRDGTFCNLEHVAAPTPRLHQRFLDAIGAEEYEAGEPLDVLSQLGWLREIGFDDVDADFKWLEIALLAGVRPV